MIREVKDKLKKELKQHLKKNKIYPVKPEYNAHDIAVLSWIVTCAFIETLVDIELDILKVTGETEQEARVHLLDDAKTIISKYPTKLVSN